MKVEDNILIAEFIGQININEGLGLWYLDNMYELNYNEDWNKLMPVVEKIELLDKVEGCKYLVTICNDICRIDTVNEEIVWKRGSTKKTAIYQAVIEFIKWYNQNNNKAL